MHSDNNKKILVEKLLALTAPELMSDADLPGNNGNTFSSHMRHEFRQNLIELHLKYYDIDQIEALHSFYDTEMGKSILAIQSRIDHEISKNVSIASEEAHHQTIEDMQSNFLSKNIEQSSEEGQ